MFCLEENISLKMEKSGIVVGFHTLPNGYHVIWAYPREQVDCYLRNKFKPIRLNSQYCKAELDLMTFR